MYKREGMHAHMHIRTIWVGTGIPMAYATFFAPWAVAPAVAAASDIPGDQLYPFRRIR